MESSADMPRVDFRFACAEDTEEIVALVSCAIDPKTKRREDIGDTDTVL